MNICGIDVGKKGGLAHISDGQITGVMRTPLAGLRGKDYVNAAKVLDFIREQAPSRIVIEQAQAMPRQGVSSVFQYGIAYGAVMSAAMLYCDEDHDCGWLTVTPSVWKRHFGLSSNKRASLDTAHQRFGAAPCDWTVLANDGIAEAALIALWYQEKHC